MLLNKCVAEIASWCEDDDKVRTLIAIDTITEERDYIPGSKKSANHNYLTLSINSLYSLSDMVKEVMFWLVIDLYICATKEEWFQHINDVWIAFKKVRLLKFSKNNITLHVILQTMKLSACWNQLYVEYSERLV